MKKLLLSLTVAFTIAATLQAQNVGVGTNDPKSKLDVSGGVSIGDSYAGTTAAPADGAIIQGQVGIGTASPDSKAALDVTSTTKGMYIPRLTTTQKNALGATLTASNKGLLVFDTDLNRTDYWDGTAWKPVGDGVGDVTLAPIGSSPNINGATLSGQQLNLQPADATHGGVVSTSAQSFAGNKRIIGNADIFSLEGTDHGYIQWFPDGNSAGRKAWTGFGGTSDDNFTVANEVNGAHIVLSPSGSGNVGIGTNDPKSKLDVSGLAKSSAYELIGTGGYIGYNAYWNGTWYYRSGTADYANVIRQQGTGGVGDPSRLSFWTAPQGTGTFSMDEKMVLTNEGKLGIGTSNPSQKLEVNGAALLKGGGPLYLLDDNHGIKSTVGVGVTIFSYQVPNGIFLEQITGNVGIGTAGPDYKLDVTGDVNSSTGYRIGGTAALGNYLRGNGSQFVSSAIQASDLPDLSGDYIQNQNSPVQTANFNITGNGYIGGSVGIGATSASQPLTIEKNTEWNILSRSTLSSNTGRNHLLLQRADGSNAVSPNFTLGGVAMGGFDGSSYSSGWNGGAEITAFANQTWTSTDKGTYLTFGTTKNNTAYIAERMRIAADGNVGIGTADPSDKLTVNGTVRVGILANNDNNAWGWGDRLYFSGSGDDASSNSDNTDELSIARYNIASNSSELRVTIGDDNAGEDYFSIGTAYGGGAYNLLVVRNDGNVGIGTRTPGYKLHVSGDVYANGGWFRVSGQQGLYWQDYGVGLYAEDGTWIRTYDNSSIWAGTGTIATDGSFSGGYNGANGPTGGAIFAGKVGIGTNDPHTKLHVADSYPFVGGDDGMLKIKSVAITGGGAGAGTEAVSLQTSIDSRTDDYTISDYGGDVRHVLALQPQGGYVGIGTTGPSYKLDVNGSIRATATVINGGFDFILGNSDQTNRGNSGASRALVKDNSNILVVNYAGDFTGGTRIGSLTGSDNRIVYASSDGFLYSSAPAKYAAGILYGSVEIGDFGGSRCYSATPTTVTGVISSVACITHKTNDVAIKVNISPSISSYVPFVSVVSRAVSAGSNGDWDNDNDQIVSVGSITSSSFEVYLREVSGNTQNIRLEVMLMVKNY